jgi:hypothetical protein
MSALSEQQTLTFVDPSGAPHEFLLRHEHLATAHVFHVIEAVDGPGGYTFAAEDYDEAAALAKLRVEVARGLATLSARLGERPSDCRVHGSRRDQDERSRDRWALLQS